MIDQKIPSRMFCQICGHLHKIDFWVPDEIWNEAIHPRWRDALTVLWNALTKDKIFPM